MSARLSVRRSGSSQAARPSILPDRRLSTATIRPYANTDNVSPGETNDGVNISFERRCSLSIHDDTFSKEEVLFNHNLLPAGWKPGQLCGIVVVKTDASGREVMADKSKDGAASVHSDPKAPGGVYDGEVEKQYLFTPRKMNKDILAKKPKLEISVAKHVADVFGFKHRSNVLVTSRSAATVSATHVEMSFRDVYLARSDMWRLTLSELSNKTVYKGQKIVFMGTIKAQVTNVWVTGRKVQSAFFSTNTKPIFRSDSARYVLFIQMSREMWDFDSEGSGEIMFTKVVNGFLPALFKRWQALNSKHLVSMVLFTRVEYDIGMTNDIKGGVEDDPYFTGHQSGGHRKPYKDFYRVVVSEMASGNWTEILFRLKKEFQDFRADITMYRLNNFVRTPTPIEVTDFTLGSVPGTRIEAEPTFAIHGNLLEAINLATSQFSSDHIDRDLLRTGISIVVITPGTGLFEVDYERLKKTTDALIGSGIGIDLICLPKIPLHSVPLFRYRNPQYAAYQEQLRMKAQGISSELSTPRQSGTAYGSYSSSIHQSYSPQKLSGNEVQRGLLKASQDPPPDEYAYAIPHWLDVSFWTGASQELLSRHGALLAKDLRHRKGIVKPRKSFAVRCKMYEIEMLGNVENTEISVPLLPEHIRRLGKTGSHTSDAPSLVKVPKKPYAGIADIHGPTRAVVDKKSSQADKDFFASLDAFDREAAFVDRPEPPPDLTPRPERKKKIQIDDHKKPPKRLSVTQHTRLQRTPSTGSLSVRSSKSPAMVMPTKKTVPAMQDETNASATITLRSATPTQPAAKSMLHSLPFKMSRHISFGFKGFGISAAKAAPATVQTETSATAQLSAVGQMSTAKNSTAAMTNHLLSTPTANNGRPTSSAGSTRSSRESIRTMVSDKSRPIAIKSHTSTEPQARIQGRTMLGSAFSGSQLAKGNDTVGTPLLQTIMSDDTIRTATNKLLAKNVPDATTLVPASAPSPWLKVLNPSNPTEENNSASQYKRWQHVFPKPVVTKAMKWKSLCSPAVVPLTTEFFPTKLQLDTEYQQKPYNISQNADDDLLEVPKTREEFLRELVALRLAQGFQIVVGAAVAEAFGQKVMKIANAFENNHISEDGTSIFLSMGNLIHQLSCVNGTEVEINMFERKSSEPIELPKERKKKEYKPAIKTHFDIDYVSSVVTLQEPVLEYNWNYVDSYIAGHEDDMTDRLKYWRARFVLIPVERQATSFRVKGEDTEEETRLEGIKVLTQIWQRHRVVPPSERRFQSVSDSKIGKRKDPNPLDIWYQTQDPSQVIAAELEGLPILETDPTQPRRTQMQLLEGGGLKRSSVNLAQLAEAIQAPPQKGGVRMQNRRWHWRLHYNCFIGSDMTTWLMENFEDIETREEAVEFGNMLMDKEENKAAEEQAPDVKEKKKPALFKHVERRHPFRDGQFFYQIIGEYARPRPASASAWPFATRRRDTSVPPTPGIETNPRESPRPERTRSSSNSTTILSDSNDPTSGTSTPTTKSEQVKRPKVQLSNMIKYDVDPRRRSYRPERINLHYDRIHNPDSCYHIRLEWMNVTAKLIEDAISTWAVTADRYGLMLVEAPIAEAMDLANKNPFRRPYLLKLALRPPDQMPVAEFDPNSLVPTQVKEKFFYQKAILRRFNFVLDMEAASNFPSSVDVTYSWGRPDYRFCQYIHRSGRVFAQVTEEGDIILTVNKMFNNRGPQARERGMHERDRERDEIRFGNDRQTAVQVQNQILRERTPHSSPMLRATLASPDLRLRASPAIRPSLMSGVAGGGSSSTLNQQNKMVGVAELAYGMERLKSDLEDFCSDVEALRAFYKEVLERTQAGLSVPATPMTGKPMLARESSVEDNAIPEIGLGPSWIGGATGGGGLGGFGGGGSLRDTPSVREGQAAWRHEGFGSLRAPPFRRGSEHASDAGSLGQGQGQGGTQVAPGSPLVNVDSNASQKS